MLPHKTSRGQAALDRMKVFDGLPHPFDKKKRVVVPQALKVLRLKPTRKFCTLGDMSQRVGWKCQDLLKRLEAQRCKRALNVHKARKVQATIVKKATSIANKKMKLPA